MQNPIGIEDAEAVAPAPQKAPVRARDLLAAKARASGVHFTLSLVIASAVFLAIYFIWYPGALFSAAGGRGLLTIIFLVDVTLGPVLTFIVFKRGKKSLVFDLSVIALVQLAALCYGVHAVFLARPAYIAFVKDRFDLAVAADLSPKELEKARGSGYERIPLDGPRVVAVRIPSDPEESMRIAQDALAGGPDLYGYPRFYRPYGEVKDDVLRVARPVAELGRFNAAEDVARELARAGQPAETLRFVPMRATVRDLAVLVDARTAAVVRISGLRPWPY